jgi:hypothetical protein
MINYNKKIIIDNFDLNVLLYLIPVFLCAQFWFNVGFGVKLNIGSYYYFVVTIFIVHKTIKNHRVILFYVLIIIVLLLSYSIVFGLKGNESLSYLVHFINFFLVIFFSRYFNFDSISKKQIKFNLTVFSIFFVILYELSNRYAWNRSNDVEYYDVVRVYKEGFVISHIATYYLAILGYALFILDRKILAILLWTYGITLGPRIGVVLILISVIFSLINSKDKIKNLLFKRRLLIIFLYIIILIWSYFIITIKYGSELLNVFTSGRLMFWKNALIIIEKDGLSWINFFGRGAGASFFENLKKFTLKIWLHNDFLDILYNLGILGLFSYLFFLYNYIHKFKAMYVLCFFLLSAFFNGFILYNSIFILVLHSLFYKKQYV